MEYNSNAKHIRQDGQDLEIKKTARIDQFLSSYFLAIFSSLFFFSLGFSNFCPINALCCAIQPGGKESTRCRPRDKKGNEDL